jgi:hypothetical protein
MMDRVVVAGVVWMFLVAAVIFLALCRISNAMEEQKLTRAGVNPENPAHLRLRNVIRSEDRFGIALTATAFLYTVFFAFLLAHTILPLR